MSIPALISRAALAAALLWAAPAAASEAQREEYTRTFEQSFTLRAGQGARIENRHGAVSVRTHDRPELQVQARIRVSARQMEEARAFGEQIRIEVRESPEAVELRTVYPERVRLRDTSFSVSYDVLLPATAPLVVRNAFGSVTATGLGAAGEIDNSHGSVTLRDARGEQRLTNRFGPIEAANITGDLLVQNANGVVRVRRVEGRLEVRNRFAAVEASGVSGAVSIHNANGSVTLEDSAGAMVVNTFGSVTATGIRGGLNVRNANGAVTARNVAGDAELTTSFGSLACEDIRGRLSASSTNARVRCARIAGAAEVRNTFGAVELREAGGGVRVVNSNAAVAVEDAGGETYIRTTVGSVSAARIAGPLTVENNNGSVRAASIQGAVRVETSFSSVVVSDAAGSVDISNQNGTVEVSRIRGRDPKGQCNAFRIQTSFSPLRIYLPEDAAFDLTARTSFGRITSDLPVTPALTAPASGDSLSGRIGAGGCELRLTNSNGAIQILRGQPPAR